MTYRSDRLRPSGPANILQAVSVAMLLLLSTTRPAAAQHAPDPTGSGVWINRVELEQEVVYALVQEFGVQVVPGQYWYDPLSGLFGLMGGPGLGFTMPGLQLGGELPANASGGGTSVFVNGRELHPLDVAAIMAVLGPVYPGRYWLRYDGYYGWEGGPPLGNLIAMAQRATGGGGYNRTTYGGHLGSDGQTSYFFDPGTGCSVISGGGVSC